MCLMKNVIKNCNLGVICMMFFIGCLKETGGGRLCILSNSLCIPNV